jgi:hypothetical protein
MIKDEKNLAGLRHSRLLMKIHNVLHFKLECGGVNFF